MNLDDHVCLCFRVSKRKLVRFVERERPVVPSQMSQCGGAGTGCGWCIPYLTLIFRQTSDRVDALDSMSADEYARGRAGHIRDGKGTPPSNVVQPPVEG